MVIESCDQNKGTDVTASIGFAFQKFRHHQQMSQRELGALLGVPNATISRIELETQNPTVELLRKMTENTSIEIEVYLHDGKVEAFIRWRGL